MDTWKVYAESKYKEFMPIIMDKLLIQTKTHPFFEAEISMVMATTWGDGNLSNFLLDVFFLTNQSIRCQ